MNAAIFENIEDRYRGYRSRATVLDPGVENRQESSCIGANLANRRALKNQRLTLTMCKCRCFEHTGGRNPSLGVLPSVIPNENATVGTKMRLHLYCATIIRDKFLVFTHVTFVLTTVATNALVVRCE